MLISQDNADNYVKCFHDLTQKQSVTVPSTDQLALHKFEFPSPFLLSPLGFPGGFDGKVSACNAGDLGSIPELERSPGEGNGNPLQYSCLENPMDGGAW